MIRVQLIRAWPRGHESFLLELPEGATVADAFAAAGREPASAAVFGERVDATTVLSDGDRVEVLRPLIADPKEARRRRAGRAGR